MFPQQIKNHVCMKNRIVVRENEQRLKIMMGVRRHQNTKNWGDVEPQSKENVL